MCSLCNLLQLLDRLFLMLPVYVSGLKLDVFKYSKDCSVSHHTVVNILCLICLYPPASFSPRRIITGQDILHQCQTCSLTTAAGKDYFIRLEEWFYCEIYTCNTSVTQYSHCFVWICWSLKSLRIVPAYEFQGHGLYCLTSWKSLRTCGWLCHFPGCVSVISCARNWQYGLSGASKKTPRWKATHRL